MAQMKSREAQTARDIGLDRAGVNITGVGSSRFDPVTGQVMAALTPELQMAQGQALQFGREEGQLAQDLSKTQAVLGDAAGTQARGLLGRAATLATGPESVAGDPLDIAQDQFQKLEGILEPGRERRRSALEGRLFSQGRLGSTGGAEELAQFEGEIGRVQQENLLNQFQSANLINQQQQQINQGQQQINQAGRGQDIQALSTTGALGQGIQGQLASQALQNTQTGANIGQLSMSLAGAAPDLANMLLAGEITEFQAIQAFNTRNQKKGSPSAGIGTAIGTVGGAAIGGAFGGPSGAVAGGIAGGVAGGEIGGLF